MKKNSSVLIAVFTLTAVVLGVILLATPSREAQANMIVNTPSVTMTTSGLLSGDDLLIITDKNSGKMLIYRLNNNAFELFGSQNLNTLFERAAAPAGH